MSQQSVLDVQDLYVTFHQDKKSAELVKGVSFSVAPGECLGILGESGSGKSMTAKAMLGLLDRSFEVRGKVFFQGESLLEKDADALRRLRGSRICMVLQNPMSCFDPLYRIGAQMAETFQEHTDWSSAEIRTKSIEVLKLMKIRDPEDVLRKYPHQMSGGMLQRVMIGLALALKPSLIICDEPTTAIDSISQYAIMQEFLRIKTSRSAAMIFISHDLGVLSLISDKLVVMHRGLAVERGLPEEIFEHAKDPYTRELIDRNALASSANRVRANQLSDVSSADCLRPTPARFVSTGSISTAACRVSTKRAFSRAFPLFFRITPLRPIRAFAYRALLGNPSAPCA